MIATRRLQAIAGLLALLLVGGAARAADVPDCQASAQAAAVRFLSLSFGDPVASVDVVLPTSLAAYRGRLQQLLDDRYAPMSKRLREVALGTDWNPERLRQAADRELVGAWLVNAQRRRPATLTAAPEVIEHVAATRSGEDVTVSYEAKVDGKVARQQRQITAQSELGCWKVRMPEESWVAMQKLAEAMKTSRPKALPGRVGPARIRLQIAAASSEPVATGVERARAPALGGTTTTWVDRTPLASEADVVGADANWDCDEGQGKARASVELAFGDEAARRIARWSASHLGEQMAVVVDGQVWMQATVRSELGSMLMLCAPDGELASADALVNGLLGVR